MSKQHNIVLGKLSHVQTKVVWGTRSLGPYISNIANIAEQEFVIPVGCNLIHMDNSSMHNRKATLVDSQYPDVLQVTVMSVSKDSKYLATGVKMKGAEKSHINILIYHISNRFHESFRPRHIHFTAKVPFDDHHDELEIVSIAFSHDSQYLAVAVNRADVGVLIFDQVKGSLFQTLVTDAVPLSTSFHPSDCSKVCITGENNLVRFWRYTAKSAHLAPVVGLRRGYHSYSCHGWLAPNTETSVVVGSTSGFIVPIQNCEQRAPAHQAFGEADTYYPNDNAICQILVKSDNVIVSSPKGRVVLYELRRVMLSKGTGLVATLVPLAFYRIKGVDCMNGLQFISRDSVTSFGLVACCGESVLQLDLITDFDLSGGQIGVKNGSSSPVASNSPNSKHPDHAEESSKVVWLEREAKRSLFKFHSKNINTLSMASRSRCFLTGSYEDATLRIWDFDQPSTFDPCWLIESFADRPAENPFHADLHPSGLQLAVATETEVREYAISDNSLDLIRRFSVRTPFQGTSGVPVVVTQPVSFVRYSNGGHLLAVVTGKIAQIFHAYSPEFDMSSPGDMPCRVIALCDHISPITDLIFLRGDTKLVTTSVDGSVYSWRMDKMSREKEFVQKGIAATHIAATKHRADTCTIAVSFESSASSDQQAAPLATAVMQRRRQSNMMQRRASSNVDTASLGDLSHSHNHSNSNRQRLGSSEQLDTTISAFLRSQGDTHGSASARPHLNSNNSVHSAQSNSTTNNTNMKDGAAVPNKFFLAVWTNDISATPTIVQLDSPVRALALGRTGGTSDRIDLCVLGFDDGRIVISGLPLPLMQIQLTTPSRPPSSSAVALGVITAVAGLKSAVKKRRQSLLTTGGSINAGTTAVSREKESTSLGFGAHFHPLSSVTPLQGNGNASNPAGSGNGGGANSANLNRKGSTVQIQMPPQSSSASGAPASASSAATATSEGGDRGGGGDDGAGEDGDAANPTPAVTIVHALDESKCRTQRLLAGAVSVLSFSVEGDWLVVGGDDGSLFMLSTHRHMSDDTAAHAPPAQLVNQGGASQLPEASNANDKRKASTSNVSVNSNSTNGTTSTSNTSRHPNNNTHANKAAGNRLARHDEHDETREESHEAVAYNHSSSSNSSSSGGNEVRFFLVERSKMLTLRTKVGDLEAQLEQTRKEHDMQTAKLTEIRDRALRDMEQKCRIELEKRDDAVLSSRKEYLALKKRAAEEIAQMQQQASSSLSTLETAYEKKIAQDALYLDRMKQAYDEALLNAQMDTQNVHEKTRQQVENIDALRQRALQEAEVQKKAVLAYYEYLQARHAEVLDTLEETQADERVRLKQQMTDAQQLVQHMQTQSMASEVHHGRVVAKYEADKRKAELDLLKVSNDVDWANDRIAKLEDALANATNELKLRSELVEKAEVKASECSKRADDLEKIRKTLLIQLETLQRDAAPKDKDLRRVSDRLQEMQREYETALTAIAEKEKRLEQKTQNVVLLQKQVRDLRMSTAQKETALERAATLLTEFLHAMQEARFMPRKSIATQQRDAFLENRALATAFGQQPGQLSSKQTNGLSAVPELEVTAGGGVNGAGDINDAKGSSNNAEKSNKKALSASDPQYLVTSLQLSSHAELKLCSLHALLQRFLDNGSNNSHGQDGEVFDEVEMARREQERHVTLLHRNILSLQRSLDSTQALAANKVHNHLADNEVLLREVNALRSEIKALSLENQRLIAQEQQTQQLQLAAQRRHSHTPFNLDAILHDGGIPRVGGSVEDGAVEEFYYNNSNPTHNGNNIRSSHSQGSLSLPKLSSSQPLSQQPQQPQKPRSKTLKPQSNGNKADILLNDHNVLVGNSALSAEDKISALIKMNVDDIRKQQKERQRKG